tara:strand:- start:340 stop:621 length:282 start_codon:yes stop_codon:yes gene_type:complete
MTVISGECFIANLEKAFQTEPADFAQSVLEQLDEEQPEVADSIWKMLGTLIKVTTDDEQTRENIAVLTLCVTGVLYKSLMAQIAANELNEAWG